MTQRQKESAPPIPAPDASLHGNPEAAQAAAKAREMLAVEVTPQETWREYLENSLTVPNMNGDFGGDNALEHLEGTGNYYLLESAIAGGYVDQNTMRWTDKANYRHQDGWICFCLVPGCTIGPFIPVRR